MTHADAEPADQPEEAKRADEPEGVAFSDIGSAVRLLSDPDSDLGIRTTARALQRL